MPSKKDKESAWNRARKIPGKNPDVYRKDEQGNTMYKSSYGKKSEMGWEVDHRNPKSKGGSDHPRNLRALNTKANRKKYNKYPHK